MVRKKKNKYEKDDFHEGDSESNIHDEVIF